MATLDEASIADLPRLSVITSLVGLLHISIDWPCAFLIASSQPASMGYTGLHV
jgi:hypothetical protein